MVIEKSTLRTERGERNVQELIRCGKLWYLGGIKKLREMTTFPQILLIPRGADNRGKIRLLFIRYVLARMKGYSLVYESLTAREIGEYLPDNINDVITGYESARYDVLVRIDDTAVEEYAVRIRRKMPGSSD